ncbi:MAG: hypothetical protein EP335_09910 [Alphaproteobacteria bacterium]|nr:MAG: hypothetical protein EP335_09910 [Alphaproteobacteria bacterium]
MLIAGALPDGCFLRQNKVFGDDRGWLYEAWRDSDLPVPVRQLTVGQSVAGSLRGMHCHVVRHDYILVMSGCMLLGLADIRPNSPTFRQTALLELPADAASIAYIPPGVAHGFGFREDTIYLTALTPHWTAEDEISFRFDDPDFGLDWGIDNPTLSPRDGKAGSMAAAIALYQTRSG